MEVKKFFHASHGLIGATHLYPLPSEVHIATTHKFIHTALHTMCPLPSIFLDPPLLRSTELANLLSVLIREYSTPLDAAIDMGPIQKL